MNKSLIRESISPIVFHFCPLSTMYEISETNSFKLTETGKYESDTRMNSLSTHIKGGKKTYPYFMCFSRTPSTQVGYQLMRINKTKNEWLNSLVRIEIDGNALNSNYKGMPVNFFTEKNPSGDLKKKYADAQDWSNFKVIPSKNGNKSDKSLFAKGLLANREMPKVNPSANTRGRVPKEKQGLPKIDYKELERNRLSEYEDRIYSNTPYIKNADKYIKRIDIFLSNKSLKQYNVLVMINKIINRYGYNNVFVYDSQIAFNSVNIRGQISKNSLNLPQYSDIGTNNIYNSQMALEEVKFEIKNSDIDALSTIIAMAAFLPNFSNENFIRRIKKICHEVGLDNWDFYDKHFDYTNQIIQYCFYKLENMFFDKNVGYEKTFPTLTQYVSSYEKRNAGKKKLMEVLVKVINTAKADANDFSYEFYNGKPMSVQMVAKRKCISYLNKKRLNLV